ncbi:NADH-quinone oxidoreductase subunit K [Pseudomonas sp. MYb185]|uniref:NADH-quinone oxidoreductase subunit K n=1 Tax=Pseudomonas sp. MYb185 TaxID=1848729 RepID=UPI000CFB2AEC|nr:NADH-quinone oxidoreductase subunit K [Pseudomonas sp. MYb185]PRB80453.1 NADH:quinone oxidoreductase [Pseudomonas sp. MYb185]
MSGTTFYLCLGVMLWLLGLHGLLRLRQTLRRIMAINVMGSGTFMVMVALASRDGHNDPVLQALVVTGLVVAVSATAFALRLAVAHQPRRSSRQSTREPGE